MKVFTNHKLLWFSLIVVAGISFYCYNYMTLGEVFYDVCNANQILQGEKLPASLALKKYETDIKDGNVTKQDISNMKDMTFDNKIPTHYSPMYVSLISQAEPGFNGGVSAPSDSNTTITSPVVKEKPETKPVPVTSTPKVVQNNNVVPSVVPNNDVIPSNTSSQSDNTSVPKVVKNTDVIPSTSNTESTSTTSSNNTNSNSNTVVSNNNDVISNKEMQKLNS